MNRQRRLLLRTALSALSVSIGVGAGAPPARLAGPVEDGPFLRPAAGLDAEPTWGVRGGIAVGLWPDPGPRGLIRVYAPYLGQGRHRVMNFVAVEPVARGSRGLSELERSDRDHVVGKAMWSSDDLDDAAEPRPPWQPARGVMGGTPGKETLTFQVHVEPFANGSRPIVEVQLRADRPYEVAFRVRSARGGAAMRACVLTATMGNYARLRRLWLRDRVITCRDLYASARYAPDGFAEHRQWGVDALRVVDGEAVVATRPDEDDPAHAEYDRDVARGWHYAGRTATQYWTAPVSAGLVARVNARKTYWASTAAIPRGAAFENFELEAPFESGQRFTFGITPERPTALGFTMP